MSLDQCELMENASKGRVLICVISCNGQSLLKVPCVLTSLVSGTTQPEFSQDAKEQTSPQILAILQGHCAKMEFSSPHKSLLVTTHCPSKRYYPISPINMLPLHEATGPSLGQGCRTTQQAEPEICSPFLRCPCWKLLACRARAFCTSSIVGIGLSFQLSRGAQPWSLLLGGSGSCMEEHRGQRLQFSTSYGPTKKGRVFLLSLHLLHACHDSPYHLSTLLQGRFLPLISQHIFLKPPNNPLQLHQPGPIQPGNAPHSTCC